MSPCSHVNGYHRLAFLARRPQLLARQAIQLVPYWGTGKAVWLSSPSVVPDPEASPTGNLLMPTNSFLYWELKAVRGQYLCCELCMLISSLFAMPHTRQPILPYGERPESSPIRVVNLTTPQAVIYSILYASTSLPAYQPSK